MLNGHTYGGLDLTSLRLAVRANGYIPVPACGKAVYLEGWRQCRNPDEGEIRRWALERSWMNTGLLTTQTPAVDIDILNEALAAEVLKLAQETLGVTPLHRTGLAPKTVLLYRSDKPFGKMATRAYRLPDGSKCQIEVLGDGQQVIAFGTHPDTKRPYVWHDASPLDTPSIRLPLIDPELARVFLSAAETMIIDAGGTLIEPPKAEKTSAAPRVNRMSASTDNGNFFKAINAAALADIESWFLEIFPGAKRQATGAWRVSSEDLGRPLEEDLSMHPTDGGRDFGTEKSVSPIDVVIEHFHAPNAAKAALWLCERLGKDPASLGWNEKPKQTAKPSKPAFTKKEADPADLADFDLTEDGVALAFAERYRNDLRYCHHTGAWFHWTGHQWRREETAEPPRICRRP